MKYISFTLPVFFIMSMLYGCFLVDDSPLTDSNGVELGEPKFASGPEYSNYYPFAEGILDAAGETLGIFMDNVATNGSLENAKMLVSGSNYMGQAYMAIVQEDVFRYAKETNEAQYDGNGTVDKTLLKVASQLQVLLALYKEDLHLLVNTNSGINSITDISNLHTVNLGTSGSGTYITAKAVMDAYGLTYTEANDDAAEGIQKVVDGSYDAAFFLGAVPSPVFQAIPESAGVELISVQMPSTKKIYDENGIIKAENYAFQGTDVRNNITVKVLLAAGPNFSDRALTTFFDYIFAHTSEYKDLNFKWDDLSLALSQEYMTENPEKCNYRAICYVSGFPELDPFYIEPYFSTDYAESSYHDMAVDLIWLLSHNINVDLREDASTGAWENAYRMLNGDTTMALVQDDLFDSLISNNDMYDSMMAASMKKIIPLHYEYLHLLVNNPVTIIATDYTIDSISDFNDIGHDLDNVKINVGPKTSGTFITAMEVIKTYGFDEDDNIAYSFASPADAVSNVNNGTCDAMFVVSGVPYNRFYSHDTWTLPVNCSIIPAQFNGTLPSQYSEGILTGGGTPQYESYPYSSQILGTDGDYDADDIITTVRVRAVLVASPVFDDSGIATYIKSIFRKAYYMTNPPDQDLWPEEDLGGDYSPDYLWIPVQKDNAGSTVVTYNGGTDYCYSHGIYDDVIGAKEYFIRHPFGWSKESVSYYLSFFPDN